MVGDNYEQTETLVLKALKVQQGTQVGRGCIQHSGASPLFQESTGYTGHTQPGLGGSQGDRRQHTSGKLCCGKEGQEHTGQRGRGVWMPRDGEGHSFPEHRQEVRLRGPYGGGESSGRGGPGLMAGAGAEAGGEARPHSRARMAPSDPQRAEGLEEGGPPRAGQRTALTWLRESQHKQQGRHVHPPGDI